jgi:hypothetical protein
MALPWLEPTRYDKTLKKFPNYRDLWHSAILPGERVEHRDGAIREGREANMIGCTKTSAKK